MSRILLFCLLLYSQCLFSQGYHIKGHIPASQNGQYIYLYGIDYSGLNPKISDSSLITNGEFHFRGKLNTPGLLASLYLKDYRVFFHQFFIENREIGAIATLRDSIHPQAKLATTNNPLTVQYQAWKKQTDSMETVLSLTYMRMDSMERTHAPATAFDSLKMALQIPKQQLKMAKVDFIRKHPGDYISLVWLRYDMSARMSDTPELVDSLFQQLSPVLKKLPEGKGLREKIAAMKRMHPGAKLPNFQLPDSSGKQIKLLDFPGQYLLVDFWASWCAPCVEAIPGLKKLYDTWQPKGLSMISISLDNEKSRWLEALNKYQLPWRHASDLKGWKSPVALHCDIYAIPSVILLDKTGMIVAINPDLPKLLPSLLK